MNNEKELITNSYEGNTEVVKKLLLKNDYTINVDIENELGHTPLIVASSRGHTEVVKLLLERKADVNKQNKNKATALIVASYRGNTEVVDLLIQT